MVYLNKEESKEITKALSKIRGFNIKNKNINIIIKKINSPVKKINYIYDPKDIKQLLKKAFREKRKVKINYYSLYSDEVRNRIINPYKIYEDCIIAYCNLRKDERTFVIERINKAALLDEKYSIPKNWKPESIILKN